jgi:electron-transferring-flavoprotein dehydrogenase
MKPKRKFPEPAPLKPDDKLTHDKLKSVYFSDTHHDEDAPSHLIIKDTSICVERCAEEFGNPCQHFCPAQVYEWVTDDQAPRGRVQIGFGNCVHCKTCDIKDPYGVIEWVVPEGGGGPKWKEL